MKKKSGFDIAEANRDRLLAWAKEGKSYFWMANAIGLGERNFSAVSKWFIHQGIFKKEIKDGNTSCRQY